MVHEPGVRQPEGTQLANPSLLLDVGYLTPSDWEPSSMQNNRFRLAI